MTGARESIVSLPRQTAIRQPMSVDDKAAERTVDDRRSAQVRRLIEQVAVERAEGKHVPDEEVIVKHEHLMPDLGEELAVLRESLMVTQTNANTDIRLQANLLCHKPQRSQGARRKEHG